MISAKSLLCTDGGCNREAVYPLLQPGEHQPGEGELARLQNSEISPSGTAPGIVSGGNKGTAGGKLNIS